MPTVAHAANQQSEALVSSICSEGKCVREIIFADFNRKNGPTPIEVIVNLNRLSMFFRQKNFHEKYRAVLDEKNLKFIDRNSPEKNASKLVINHCNTSNPATIKNAQQLARELSDEFGIDPNPILVQANAAVARLESDTYR